MLTKVRIEVEEQTVAEAVEALAKYEHAIICAEAQRYEAQWPAEFVAEPGKEPKRVGPPMESHWDMPFEEREFFEYTLGAELLEEVIEYDKSLPAWRGRRVVAYKRLDTRSTAFTPITGDVVGFTGTGDLIIDNSRSAGSGTDHWKVSRAPE